MTIPTRRAFLHSLPGFPVAAALVGTPGDLGTSSRPQSATVCDVLAFGAVGNGIADDTAAIAAAVAGCPPSGILLFPGTHRYRMRRVEIAKNLIVLAEGAAFVLDGVNAGFTVVGKVDCFRIRGGTFFGSGNPQNNQMAWTFGNVPDAEISNVSIEGLTTRDCTVGVKIAGTPERPILFVTVTDCRFFDSAGVVGGTGYGLQFTQGNYGKAIGCHFERCQRHGLYFAEGKHYVAMGNTFRLHRSTISDGNMRAAFSISRSDNVTAVGNVFDECHDGTVAIDTDLYGTQCRNITFSGNAFQNSHGFDIVVGSTEPAQQGRPENVIITCNTFRRDPEVPAGTFLDVRAASHLTIGGNSFFHEAISQGTPVAVLLRASGGDQFTNYVQICQNLFRLDSTAAEAYYVELGAALVEGASVVDIRNNLDHSKRGVLTPGQVRNRNLQIGR